MTLKPTALSRTLSHLLQPLRSPLLGKPLFHEPSILLTRAFHTSLRHLPNVRILAVHKANLCFMSLWHEPSTPERTYTRRSQSVSQTYPRTEVTPGTWPPGPNDTYIYIYIYTLYAPVPEAPVCTLHCKISCLALRRPAIEGLQSKKAIKRSSR